MSDLIKFEYNSKGIRGDDDRKMLNLTDMWRADGADPNRAPYEWARKEGRTYIDFLRGNVNTPVGRNEVIRALRGGTDPCTWATTKVALAYGMYLSPEFQDHCLGIILSVYSDGGYVVPGREAEFLAKLQEVTNALTLSREEAELSRKAMEGVSLRVMRIEARQTGPGLVDTEQAKDIVARIARVARSRYERKAADSVRSETMKIDNTLRYEIGFPRELGACWECLPLERLGAVNSKIKMLEAVEKRAIARLVKLRKAATQLPIGGAQ